MKIDCSKTKNHLEEKARMTKNCGSCFTCPLNNNIEGVSCGQFELLHSDKAIKIVQAWSDKHEQKTYREDFFEKFPNAPCDEDKYPCCLTCSVYSEFGEKCINNFFCKGCWDKIMEE